MVMPSTHLQPIARRLVVDSPMPPASPWTPGTYCSTPGGSQRPHGRLSVSQRFFDRSGSCCIASPDGGAFDRPGMTPEASPLHRVASLSSASPAWSAPSTGSAASPDGLRTPPGLRNDHAARCAPSPGLTGAATGMGAKPKPRSPPLKKPSAQAQAKAAKKAKGSSGMSPPVKV